MTQHPDSPSTRVLLIDPSKSERTLWAAQLRRCSSAYEILEAADGKSGLALYRSRRIDCVVLELDFLNQTGFRTLMELVPIASRPQIAVIVLTKELPRGVWELVTQVGAYACLVKPYTRVQKHKRKSFVPIRHFDKNGIGKINPNYLFVEFRQ